MKTTPARRSPQESETYRRRLLRDQERSGQSVRDFAAERGLSCATLYAWRRRLGLARPHGAGRRLLEVALVESQEHAPRSGLVLQLFGRHRLELPRDVSHDELLALLRALSAC
jgi:transposase-like protein